MEVACSNSIRLEWWGGESMGASHDNRGDARKIIQLGTCCANMILIFILVLGSSYNQRKKPSIQFNSSTSETQGV